MYSIIEYQVNSWFSIVLNSAWRRLNWINSIWGGNRIQLRRKRFQIDAVKWKTATTHRNWLPINSINVTVIVDSSQLLISDLTIDNQFLPFLSFHSNSVQLTSTSLHFDGCNGEINSSTLQRCLSNKRQQSGKFKSAIRRFDCFEHFPYWIQLNQLKVINFQFEMDLKQKAGKKPAAIRIAIEIWIEFIKMY